MLVFIFFFMKAKFITQQMYPLFSSLVSYPGYLLTFEYNCNMGILGYPIWASLLSRYSLNFGLI